MGDILKNNPILSHILIPLLLIFMFFLLFGKPYVDRGDDNVVKYIDKKIDVEMDTLISIGNETIRLINEK